MDPVTYLTTLTNHWQIILIAFISIFVMYGLIQFGRLGLNRHFIKKRQVVWFEITPPAQLARTPAATQQLFSVVHGTRAARRFKDKLLGRLPVMSFEIVSTKQEGIRYQIQVDRTQAPLIRKAITTYIPESKVRVIDPPPTPHVAVLEFTQAKHYVLPIMTAELSELHDPLSYITGAMTNLEDTEQITLQLIITPARIIEAQQLSRRILANEDILHRVQAGNTTFIRKLFEGLGGLGIGIAEQVGEMISPSPSRFQHSPLTKNTQLQSQIAKRQRPARTLSPFELELMESMHQKVTTSLFFVDLRVMITSNSPQDHFASFRSALDSYSVPPYQELKAKSHLPGFRTYRAILATRRLPSLFQRHGMVLSAAEIAGLYHVPSSHISKTDNLRTSLSRTLPAPVSLKQDTDLDVILGQNEHHGTQTPIGLTEAERGRHVYMIGGTGNGKTTLLQYAIVQDMQRGKGVAVVDPHGDMAETLLRHIPQHRLKDVVYFNPDDLEYPIGLNLLELTPGLTGNELLREKDIITESVISIFRKIFSDADNGGHRIEYVLRNAVQTALTTKDPTLFTIFDLLNDTAYRKTVTKTLTDINLQNFWKNELGKAGDMQKVKMVAGITAKIGRFLFSASARQILGQPQSTIDFDDIINSGKILICNVSKGLLGEDTSELFGITVLAKLQLASLRRARLFHDERRPFYLYVDEFQNFATPSFVQMLSESRKYKLFLTMAEQSTSQQDDQQMVSIILANVGTVLCFRTGNPNDERLLLPLFSPYIEQREISNLPAYSFYAKLSAIHPQEPLSGHTLLLSDEGSDEIATRAVQHSRETFAKKQENIHTVQVQPSIKRNPLPGKPTPKNKLGNLLGG